MTLGQISIKTSSLWRESFRCFFRHWRPWVKIAVWFLIVMVVFFNFISPPKMRMTQQILSDKTIAGSTASLPTMTDFAFLVALLIIILVALLIIILVKYYLFNVLFLSREQVLAKEIRPSFSGFWYYVWQKLLLTLILILPPILIGAIVITAKLGARGEGTGSTVGGLFMITNIMAAYAFSLYLAIKYFLVGVLACGRIKSTLKTSWDLTRGNWWRLLGNSLVVSFLLALIFMPALMLKGVLTTLFPSLSLLISSVITTAFGVLSSGVLSAFGCTALRILYEERKQAEPQFTLVSKV